MSKENLRRDKTCLNCHHVVEKRFCANCGQENIESRKTFHHLFTHFAEDLVHYDGAFWKTVKALLFRPALLTKEYLSGKRKTYVPPVKLYIFINFLTFFLLSIFTSSISEELQESNNQKVASHSIVFKQPSGNDFVLSDFKSVKALDSTEAAKPKGERLNRFEYWVERKFVLLNLKYTPIELFDNFKESFLHNLPKALFLYMPVFALMLWLFHGKKRWFYFDHGIFTLHYFSFILLTFSFFLIVNFVLGQISDWLDSLSACTFFAIEIWWFFYFFRSHSKFYGERKLISRLKSLALFFINVAILFCFLLMAALYTAISMH